ncbi:unnamed protein product, partial [marine sediment metagenome]
IKKNKKAQIGETMTWVVATIIIIVILVISLYTTSLLAQTKKVIHYKYKRAADLIMEKSLFSYFLVKDETKKTFIHNQLKEQEFYADLDDKFEEINMNLRAG